MENWHTRNKEKGLCPDCGAVKENPESYRCDKCKAYHHNYYVESKEFFLSRGICPICVKSGCMAVISHALLAEKKGEKRESQDQKRRKKKTGQR